MNDFLARVQVMATTFVTWAVIVSAGLSGAAAALQSTEGVPGAAKAAAWLTAALGAVGNAIRIVRSVTPVAPEQRGILPPEKPPLVVLWTGRDNA